ncbi:MAG: TIGR04438 family Trp-rich protein [Ottowia sp.]
MYLLGLGIALMLMKYFEIGPVAGWSWWWIFAPFGGAALWWHWADATGYTKRKAMEREYREAQERRERNMEALGQRIVRKRRR